MALRCLLLGQDTGYTRPGGINAMLERSALHHQQVLCLTAHRALMGCSTARCNLSTAA